MSREPVNDFQKLLLDEARKTFGELRTKCPHAQIFAVSEGSKDVTWEHVDPLKESNDVNFVLRPDQTMMQQFQTSHSMISSRDPSASNHCWVSGSPNRWQISRRRSIIIASPEHRPCQNSVPGEFTSSSGQSTATKPQVSGSQSAIGHCTVSPSARHMPDPPAGSNDMATVPA